MLKQNRYTNESPSELGIRPHSKAEQRMINKHLKTVGKTVVVGKDTIMPVDVKESKKVKVVRL